MPPPSWTGGTPQVPTDTYVLKEPRMKFGAGENPGGSDAPPVFGRPTLAEATGCDCPRKTEGGCVDDLKLPALQGQYRHTDGRRGVFLGRRRFGDPITGMVRYTTVTFRDFSREKPILWTLRCAPPRRIENRYEAARPDRPPARARDPFKAKKPVNDH
nr:hypothetical protein KPHV_40300 [Kitasatospora purpeofusca]